MERATKTTYLPKPVLDESRGNHWARAC